MVEATVPKVPEDADIALAERVNLLRRRFEMQEAEAIARDGLQRFPDSPDVLIAFGRVLLVTHRREDAVRIFSQAGAALNDDRLRAWRIASLSRLRAYEEALTIGVETLKEFPNSSLIRIAIGRVYLNSSRPREALRYFVEATAVAPKDWHALAWRTIGLGKLCQWEEAQELAHELVSRYPEKANSHYTLGRIVLDAGDPSTAVRHFDKALDLEPNCVGALEWRVTALSRLRHYSEAEESAINALKLLPRCPRLHVKHGWLFGVQDRENEAVAATERALAIDPRHSRALQSRINFLRYGRRFEEAEQAAHDAVQRQPDDPNVHVTTAWLFSVQDRENEAVAATERALAIDPRHSRALQSRINFLRYGRRFEEAEQAAHDAVERQPNDPESHVELGRMHDYGRRFDTAVDCFTGALRREPNHTGLNLARSATLRSLRRFTEAERQITQLCRLRPHGRDLKIELGWIHHDERRFVEARRLFEQLLDSAVNDRERAATHHALGWVAFSEGEYGQAEDQFRRASTERPDDLDYMLAMAWALARREGKPRLREAERIAAGLLERRPGSSVHICLGVLAFKQGNLASAEYHLRKALEVDPHHGSYTDLGALYVQMGRYAEAEKTLNNAIARDWYDASAHIELGALCLQVGDERTFDAEQEFRQALAIDPSSGAAAIGLAQSLSKAGNETEAESTLRRVLTRQNAPQRWRSHLALARLLVQRGDKQQNPELHAEAYAHAQRAIESAPDIEADPHFVAGVAHHRMGSLTADARGRFGFQRRAAHHLRECVSRDSSHAEAQRNLQLLEREQKSAAPIIWGGYAVASISFLLLGIMWTSFFFSDKVTALMLTTTTPVLVGMFMIAVLLPALIRLKLPGFEAHLQAGVEEISPGPTGQVTFDPGRFTVTAGPSGQLPRRE